MTLQNNKELLPVIQKIGCLYLCLVRMVELETNTDISTTDINSIWLEAKEKNYVSDKNDIVDPDRIIRLLAAETTNPELRLAQVGILTPKGPTFWLWAKRGNNINYIYCIEKVKTSGPVGTHFRLCNMDRELIFDSYSFK